QSLRRLVHDQTIRVGHEPASDREHLLFAAGERSGALAAALAQARKQRVDALHIPAAAVDAALGDHQILLDAERGKYAPTLRTEPHSSAQFREGGNRGDIRPLE